MTFLETLQSHKGGLLHLKTELFWDVQGWDRNPGRVCLLLDAPTVEDAAIRTAMQAITATTARASTNGASALLLIDGAPHWVWVYDTDVEFL